MKYGSNIKIAALILTISLSSMMQSPLFAQSDSAIVDEPDAAADLRDAIRRIGKSPTDSNALYDAGEASIRLGDPAIALDFFQRAERLAPAVGKIKAGMGRAELDLENPVEALRLFDLALNQGHPARDIALERGLAFDLIGNFEQAQLQYDLAKRYQASKALTIRHAISLSLGGDINAADALLLPLLKENDPLAWRARSFMLAARGKTSESYEIAEGFLNANDARNLRPYLKSMKKLTGAQQAAAIHYGHFPDSKAIGKDRDDIRIASTRSSAAVPRSADRLIPVGKPLGVAIAKKDDKPKAVRQKKNGDRSAATRPAAKKGIIGYKGGAQLAKKTDITPPINEKEVAVIAEENVKVAQLPEPVTPPAPKFTALIPIQARAAKSDNSPKIVDAPNLPKPKDDGANSGPNFAQSEAVKTNDAAIANAVVAEKKELDLDSFLSAMEIADDNESQAVAVDLDAIKAEQAAERKAAKLAADKRRAEKAQAQRQEAEREEAAAKKRADEAEKAEAEKNKARYWVQLATGRNVDALKFDYRRISRKQSELFKGKSASTSKWGSTNRLVVGPFKNLAQSKAFESEFRKGGGDGFVWRSGNGTVVTSIE